MKREIKIIIFFLILLIYLSSLDALMLSVSPANTTFDTLINKETCKKISIAADKTITIMIEDRWKINGKSSELKDYNLDSSQIDIKISYPEQISIQNRKYIDLCITPEKVGNYNGVIILKSSSNPIGLGSLVELNVFESYDDLPSDPENYDNKIAGNVVDDNEQEKNHNFVTFLIFNAIFLITLFFIIIKIKSSRKESA